MADLKTFASEDLAFQGRMRLRCSVGFEIRTHAPRQSDGANRYQGSDGSADHDDLPDCWFVHEEAGVVAAWVQVRVQCDVMLCDLDTCVAVPGVCVVWPRFGKGFGDPDIHNLWYTGISRRSDTLACVFKHATNAGFAAMSQASPHVQLVFEYTTLRRRRVRVPTAADDSSVSGSDAEGGEVDAGSGIVEQWQVVRRLRVLTARFRTGFAPLDMYRPTTEDVVVYLVAQQALHAITDGASTTRMRVLVRDWLANLYAAYHKAANKG